MQSKALLSRLSAAERSEAQRSAARRSGAQRGAAELSGVERNEAGGAGRENKNPQKFLGLLGVLVCF